MRKVKRILAFHFDAGRSARVIATHCGLARRSVAHTLERFAASGLSWPEARDLDEEVLEAALYRRSRASDWPEVDWAKVEKDLSGRGMTLMLLWEEWRETHPDGMSYPTWCRRFREWRPRRDVTMRQNRRPGERLFVDYAGMTIALLVDGVEHKAQVFVASMGVSGRLYAEATLTQKIEDWCASHVRCFEDMGWAPQAGGARQHQGGGERTVALRAGAGTRLTPICSNITASRACRRGSGARATRDSSSKECFTLSVGSWRRCATMSSMIWRR